MNFLFWNIKRKTNPEFITHLVDLLIEEAVDVLMLAELPEEDISDLKNKLMMHKYKLIEGKVFKKVVIFAVESVEINSFDETNKRIGAFRIKSNELGKEILLFAIHYFDKYSCSSEEQNEKISNIKDFIEDAEKRHGSDDMSVICGDFNMEPYETPMIKANGMHATMDSRIALKGKRVVDGKDFNFFYNPMWAFYGDNGKGNAPGTFFMRKARMIEQFWYMLDQVLVRKGLIPYMNDSELKIVTMIKGVSLLKADGVIDSSNFSDHLPVKFCLNI